MTASAADSLPLDQHGATFPTTSSLIAAISDLRSSCTDDDHTLALVAASVSNAGEIVDFHGTRALESLTTEIARRMLQHDHLPSRLLRVTPLGGFLVAVLVRRDLARSQVADLVAGVRHLVPLNGELVWPVVTFGARLFDDADDDRTAIREVRATVVAAARQALGDIMWHQPADNDSGHMFDLPLVRDLAHALHHGRDQVELHYQPVRDLRTGALMAAEALLRWNHPQLGRMSPAHTVEAAERSGLIVQLGRCVLDTALRQMTEWVDWVPDGFRVHVNVSPLELRNPDYVDHLEAALDHYEIAPSRLLLEVTETALVSDEHVVQSSLSGLVELGVALGIDDFGTGYSSIVHLQRLPIDTVKIDRSLVSGIATNPADFTLARSVFQLVSTLGVSIVAEGIESELEAAHLRAMGCVLGQGYHLGRPAPAADLESAGEGVVRRVASTA